MDPLRLSRLLSAGLEAAWNCRLLTPPTLEPDDLLATAARAGPSCLGQGNWRAAFELLTEDLRGSARLNALGRTIAHGQLVGILRQRILAARLWQRCPQILDLPIREPVIVLGHMRSGTTRLHRLLACDPRFAFTRLHETLAPLATSSARSIASTMAVQSLLHLCNPQLRRIHPTFAFAPEEEFGLHAHSFHGAMFEAQWNVPRFARHSERRDPGPVYLEFRRLVQTLRWRRREPEEKVQLLKAPQFMAELDSVLGAFPGARLLWVRRDLGEVVASTASLVWNQRRIQSDSADRHAIGREWLDKTRMREERALAALRKHDPPTLEIEYAALNGDWRPQIQNVYRFLRYDLSPAVERRMAKVAGSIAHQGHRYSPEEFGLAPWPA